MPTHAYIIVLSGIGLILALAIKIHNLYYQLGEIRQRLLDAQTRNHELKQEAIKMDDANLQERHIKHKQNLKEHNQIKHSNRFTLLMEE